MATPTSARWRCAHAVAVVALLQFVTRSAVLSSSTSRAGGGFAAVLDEVDRCAATAADPWPCLRRGCRRLMIAAAECQDEISLVGPYLTVAPAARHAGRQAAAGNGTSSSVHLPRLVSFAEGRMLRASLPLDAVLGLLEGGSGGGYGASDQPRGKKDKGAGVLMLGGMMMITTLMSTAFGALALMAAKSLFTSILALMLSAMAIAKKSGYGNARTTYEVINAPLAHHYQDEVTRHKFQENGFTAAAAMSDINTQYNTAQSEPIQYGNQQYD